MNLYRSSEFKCGKCQHWFHPVNAKPYLMLCEHSVCGKCVSSLQSKGKDGVFCPYHKSQQLFSDTIINQHVQDALKRLVKDLSE